MLRSAGIRSKILAVLVVPLVLLSITTGLLGTSQVLRAREAYQVEAVAGASAVLPQLTADLALERSTTKAALQGDAAAAAALPGHRQAVDSGIVAFDQAVAEVDLDRLSTGVARAVAEVQTAHDELIALRTGVDDGSLLLGSSSEALDGVLDAHLQMPGRVGPNISDQETSAALIGLGHLLVTRDLYLDEQQIGLRLLSGTATSVEITDFRAFGRAQSAELARWEFAVGAPEGSAELLDAAGDRRGTAWSMASARTALSAAAATSGLTPEVWLRTTAGRADAVAQTVDAAVVTLLDRSERASSAATAFAAAAVMAAVVGVGVTLLLSLLLSRRISRPLRELTAAAASVREQLPLMVEQMRSPGQMPDVQLPRIDVRGDDEVGRLAAAFNAVNDTVVEVAEEQAALRGSIAETFVNVARRNQVLLSRQLSFIDQLEQREENPDTLENLFRLDHLATRMRRNAESLLVLANIDAGRRLRQPLALSDVIRTAASEIEQYERVNLALQVDPPTMGHLSLQLAHLLAELLENGTNFSEPHTPVLVATSRTSAGVRITVTDEGLGLTDDEIETARAKISDFAADDVVTSQRLGFFVVGRLARRLGVTVAVRRGSAKGLVVTVDLPPSVFVPGTVTATDPETGRPIDAGAPSDAAPGRPTGAAPPPAPGTPAPGAPSARPQVPGARPGRAPSRPDAPAGAAAAPTRSAPAPRPAPPVLARPTGVSIPMPGPSTAPDPTQAVTVTPGGITLPRRGPAAPGGQPADTASTQPASTQPASTQPAPSPAPAAPGWAPPGLPTRSVGAPAAPTGPTSPHATGSSVSAGAPAPAALSPVVEDGAPTLPTRARRDQGAPTGPSAATALAGPATPPARPAAAPARPASGTPDGPSSAAVPGVLDRTPAASLPSAADASAPPRRAGLFGAFRARREGAELLDGPSAMGTPDAGHPAPPPSAAPRTPSPVTGTSPATPPVVPPLTAPPTPVPATDRTPSHAAPAFVPPVAAPAFVPPVAAPAFVPPVAVPAPVPPVAAPASVPPVAVPAPVPPVAAPAFVPPVASPAPVQAPPAVRPTQPPPVRPIPASPPQVARPAPASTPAAAPTVARTAPAAASPVSAPASEPAPLLVGPVSILPGGAGARRRGRRSLFGPKGGPVPVSPPAGPPPSSTVPTVPSVPFPAPVAASRPASTVPAQGTGPARAAAPPVTGAPAGPLFGTPPPAGPPGGAPSARGPAGGGPSLSSRRSPAAPVGGPATVGGVPVVAALADGEAVRQRSMLASEALSELSRLSSYSPSAVEGRGGPAPLVRRQPAATEAAKLPVQPVGPAPERRPRSAADVRSMLSGFQSGVTRGRAGGDDGPDGADTEVPGARVPVDSLTTTRSTTDTRTTD